MNTIHSPTKLSIKNGELPWMVQWLRFGASTAGHEGSSPDQGTVQHSQRGK